MEFIVCMILASIFTGGRIGVDMFHAAKGTTPPHVEKARLKADRERQRLAAQQARVDAKNQPRPAAGKPGLRDVAAVYWGDAMADAIASHDRRRTEKRRQCEEDKSAYAGGRKPRKVGPSWRERLARLKDVIVNGPQPAKASTEPPRVADVEQVVTDTLDGPRIACDVCGATLADASGGHRHPPGSTCPKALPAEPAPPPRPDPVPARPQPSGASSQSPAPNPPEGATMTAVTGEAVNYETAIIQLDLLAEQQQVHLEHALKALEEIRAAKLAISNTQASYRPAAQAAATVHDALTALGLDSETVANTGTIADAMPPNAVDDMFARLEEMEAAAVQQVANAEAALAATAQARATIVAKYGDAHATVQGELGGDSRFLGDGGVAAQFRHIPANLTSAGTPQHESGQVDNPQDPT